MKATWRTTADEPASAQLRRLLPSTAVNARAAHAALPALADLVAAVEHEVPHEREPGHFCGSPLCRALAAVHAALEAK